MKFWMMALSFVALLGMTTLADAKGAGKHGHGTKGKITAVSGNSFTMTTGSKKKGNEATMTVKLDGNTTVDGVAGGKIDASMVGKHVSVVGASDGTTITASSVTTSKGHHKKKAA